MTKNQLIAILQTIEGNPKICIWNGYVSDYNEVEKVDMLELVKETVDFIESTLKDEYRVENKVATIPEEVKKDILNTAKSLHKQAKWDLPNPYVTGERFKRWYGMKSKKMVLLTSKPRNKTSHDRLGSIDY